jgi:hypothetical protein
MPTDTRLDLGAELERRVIAKGGTRPDIVLTLEQRGDVLDACADLIVSAAREMKARIELSIVVKDGETFDGLVAAGKYDWKCDWVNGGRFPVRQSAPGERKLVVLHFGRDISPEDAIKEAERQGLERPTHEDCLRFGAQHPEVQRQFPVVFLHEPVRDDLGFPRVLCLNRRGSERILDFGWFGNGWRGGCRFVFVRK